MAASLGINRSALSKHIKRMQENGIIRREGPDKDGFWEVICDWEDENIWLTQKLLAELYGVSVPAINQHIKQVYKDNELEESATIKKYLIVQDRLYQSDFDRFLQLEELAKEQK